MKKNYIGITGFTEKIQVLDTLNFIKTIIITLYYKTREIKCNIMKN